jgi:hypothetical protein
MPASEGKFLEWSDNLITVSTDNATAWNLPQDKLAELRPLHNEARRLYDLCQTSSYTKLDMQAKHEKMARLIHLEEVFVRNNLQNNDAMTNNGREALRIPIYDTKPTPHPAPQTIPDIVIETPLPRMVRIKFRAVGAKRWAKPQYVHGLECLWVISEKAPAKIEELLRSSFATRSPLELSFDEDERGKRLYFAVRWENSTVNKGPWSDIAFAIIP